MGYDKLYFLAFGTYYIIINKRIDLKRYNRSQAMSRALVPSSGGEKHFVVKKLDLKTGAKLHNREKRS